MPKVWLIRHGESISNVNLPTTHPAASPLTARGEEEAKAVVSAFQQTPDLIVVSPYLRARQTAVPTQNQFPHTPVVKWPVYEFTYLHPQKYNGTTGSERVAYAQAYWQRNDPFEKEDGGGESFFELLQRLQKTKEMLANHPANFIVVFSHGLFLRGLQWHLLTDINTATQETMEQYHQYVWGVHMPNCAILEVNFTPHTPVTLSEFMIDHLSNA